MSLFAILKLGVAASVIFCMVFLAVILMRTFAFSRKSLYAQPQGSSLAGVFYSFGQGMLPWEKESAARHILTYTGGILYHIGILIAFLFLATVLLGTSLPWALLWPARIVLTASVLSGLALLAKRIIKTQMRALSSSDDYLANVLVDLLLFSALAATFWEPMSVPFLLLTIIVFIYIPLGKLRHCAFFFYSRILFGTFFGRRDVLPHTSNKV